MDLREEVWVSCVSTEMIGESPLGGVDPMKGAGGLNLLADSSKWTLVG